jgi:hypothetical protein
MRTATFRAKRKIDGHFRVQLVGRPSECRKKGPKKPNLNIGFRAHREIINRLPEIFGIWSMA